MSNSGVFLTKKAACHLMEQITNVVEHWNREDVYSAHLETAPRGWLLRWENKKGKMHFIHCLLPDKEELKG